MDGDLRVSVATHASAYLVGQPITIYMSVENTGTTARTIPNPSMISPLQAYTIVPGNCVAADQPGCSENRLWFFPFAYFFFGVPLTVDPGQCIEYQVTWDGAPEGGGTTSPGAYAIFAAPGHDGDGANNLFPPEGGVRLGVLIGTTSTVPVAAGTWGNLKTRYP
jgi:hypothetical protein